MIEVGALALRARMDAGEITAQDVMAEMLARIDAVNGTVNAIVSLRDADGLMADAAAADATAKQGWLHGIPMAIKDLDNVAGLPTSMGSPLFAGTRAPADDLFVSRLRAAGAIFIGKTNTPEFGLGSHTTNPVFGPTRNPYNTARSAGGSSGGAGVGLATAMLSVADGSDAMGSLRNPAGWNNVYGMRPTWGLVPAEPGGELFQHNHGTNGPMARTPRDLAALLDTMAGPDPRLRHCVEQPLSLPQLEGGATGMRVGWLGNWDNALAMEPGVLDVCAAALRQMGDIGVHVDTLAAPFSRDALWESWTTLRGWFRAGAMADLHADAAQRALLKDTLVWEIEQGLAVTAMQVYRADEIRSEWFRASRALFDQYDVLALPSAQMWPFDVTLDYPREIAGTAMDTYHRWMEVVIPASLIGLPAICVPAGFGGLDDLPMGLQLIGPRGSDAKLLRLAEAWHQATDWPGRRPPNL